MAEAQLLPGKTLDSFNFDTVPMISKAHVLAICAGDSWIDKGANLILIGGPGGGKTHLASVSVRKLLESDESPVIRCCMARFAGGDNVDEGQPCPL